MEEGYLKGDVCGRDGCIGIIDEHEKEGGCSCHINPPCSYCETSTAYCKECGWDVREEDTYVFEIKLTEEQIERAKKRAKEMIERENIFYQKWNGKIPADKLEVRRRSHTHFSMIVEGVFPEGTETISSLLPKIRGTFGGRWDIYPEKYKFRYIAYTD